MAKGATSRRFVTGTIAINGDCAASTEAAVVQTGQMWEGEGAAVKSVQKWNCAARKTTPRSNARMGMLRDFVCMCLLGRSLGRNRCRVKFGGVAQALFLGEIRFGLGELRTVRACAADFGELGIKRLRSAGIAGGLRGTSGA